MKSFKSHFSKKKCTDILYSIMYTIFNISLLIMLDFRDRTIKTNPFSLLWLLLKYDPLFRERMKTQLMS